MGKMKLRQVKWLIQEHTAHEEQTLDLNRGQADYLVGMFSHHTVTFPLEAVPTQQTSPFGETQLSA